MRVLKGNTASYIPFYQAVRDIALDRNASLDGEDDSQGGMEEYGLKIFEKQSYLLKIVLGFEKEAGIIEATKTDPMKLMRTLKNAVKKIISSKDVVLFFLDEEELNLESFDPETPDEIVNAINSYYKEGIFSIMFENRNPILLPHFAAYNQLGSKLNYIIFPIVENDKRRGVFAILTAGGESDMSDLNKQVLDMLFRSVITSIDKVFARARFNRLHEELQTYQAKLSNDFRLAAIGELTEGIVEEIVSPLQVIMSQVDLLNKEGHDESSEVKRIKGQINKVNSVVSRLVKFASLNRKNVKIEPCNLNDMVNEYYRLVKSSLDNLKIECVLDLEQNLPPILTHPNYANQLFANIFGMIKTRSRREVGVLLQTRFKGDTVLVKFICTVDITEVNNSAQDLKNTSNMTMKILENLMKKHEGYINVESFQGNGSQITLGFPLRRKIRQ